MFNRSRNFYAITLYNVAIDACAHTRLALLTKNICDAVPFKPSAATQRFAHRHIHAIYLLQMFPHICNPRFRRVP